VSRDQGESGDSDLDAKECRWRRRIVRTIRKLQGIIRAEWSKARRYPDDVVLYPLAVRVENLRLIGGGNLDLPKRPRRRLSPLERTGRAFLRQLARVVTSSGVSEYIAQDGDGRRNQPAAVIFDRRDIVLRDSTRRLVEHALDRFAPASDPARYLADSFKDAWERTRVRVSTSATKEGAPLCQAVTATLILAGIEWSPATVCEHLRRRERRRRSGSIRNRGGRKKP
jgi:hypothetical protein